MNTRRPDNPDRDRKLARLAEALAGLADPVDVRDFLIDLCTPAELDAMGDRWRIVPLLRQGIPYREIQEQTGVSVTTVGRVARTLEYGTGGYARAVHQHEHQHPGTARAKDS